MITWKIAVYKVALVKKSIIIAIFIHHNLAWTRAAVWLKLLG